MTQTDKLRAALVKNPGATCAGLRTATGIKNPAATLAGMIDRGEVIANGEGAERTHTLDANYTPARKVPKRRARRLEGFKAQARAAKAAKKKRAASYADLVGRARCAAQPAGFASIAIDNHIAAGETLRDYLRENLEDLEKDTMLVRLLENHERAESMVKAARAQA